MTCLWKRPFCVHTVSMHLSQSKRSFNYSKVISRDLGKRRVKFGGFSILVISALKIVNKINFLKTLCTTLVDWVGNLKYIFKFKIAHISLHFHFQDNQEQMFKFPRKSSPFLFIGIFLQHFVITDYSQDYEDQKLHLWSIVA